MTTVESFSDLETSVEKINLSEVTNGGDNVASCDNIANDLASCDNLIRQVVDEGQTHSIIRRSQEEAYPGAVFIVEPDRVIGQESANESLGQIMRRYWYNPDSHQLNSQIINVIVSDGGRYITDLKVLDDIMLFLEDEEDDEMMSCHSVSRCFQDKFWPINSLLASMMCRIREWLPT